jgi:hypothetical protein
MGLKDANLDYYNNMDDSLMFQFRMSQFERGSKCECGEKISSENVHLKKSCSSNEALTNHIIFPTRSILARPGLAARHWALLVEIKNVKKASGFVSGFTHLQEFCTVNLRDIDYSNESNERTFDWADMMVGYTLAVLYAEVNEVSGMTKRYFKFISISKLLYLQN